MPNTPEIIETFKKIISTVPETEVKGKDMFYTSMNGNMYTLLGKDGKIGIRLSKTDFDEFIKQFNAQPLKQYGSFMNEYVEIPEKHLNKVKELQPWVQKCHNYAKTLPTKATKKKK